MSYVRLSARAQSDLTRLRTFLANKDVNAAQRAMLVIREAFMPLTHAPMIGRPVEDTDGLRELVIDFGASGYLALSAGVGGSKPPAPTSRYSTSHDMTSRFLQCWKEYVFAHPGFEIRPADVGSRFSANGDISTLVFRIRFCTSVSVHVSLH